MNLDEIARALESGSFGSQKLWEIISRDTAMHTVALFAVSGSANGDVLQFAGTGTLIAVGDSHYILTAAHVWDKYLRAANKLGISLRENLNHKCLMDIDSIMTFGPSRPANWNEWGPDIIFLRIPPARVGEIEAFRVFYRQTVEGQSQIARDHIEAHFLIGAPKALGNFSQAHADLEIVIFRVDEPKIQTQGDFDYLDVIAQMPRRGNADSFGGVSGGGLWKVRIYSDPYSEGIASDTTLEGVAFYQIDVNGGVGTIRCHGPESIQSAMPIV